jgi:hypothetical protein
MDPAQGSAIFYAGQQIGFLDRPPQAGGDIPYSPMPGAAHSRFRQRLQASQAVLCYTRDGASRVWFKAVGMPGEGFIRVADVKLQNGQKPARAPAPVPAAGRLQQLGLAACEYCHRARAIDATSCVCGACKGYVGGGVGPLGTVVGMVFSGAIAAGLFVLEHVLHRAWIGGIASLVLLLVLWSGYCLVRGPVWHRSRARSEMDAGDSDWAGDFLDWGLDWDWDLDDD